MWRSVEEEEEYEGTGGYTVKAIPWRKKEGGIEAQALRVDNRGTLVSLLRFVLLLSFVRLCESAVDEHAR